MGHPPLTRPSGLSRLPPIDPSLTHGSRVHPPHLCQAEYDQLPATEKLRYAAIPPVAATRRLRVCRPPAGFKGRVKDLWSSLSWGDDSRLGGFGTDNVENYERSTLLPAVM